MAIILSLTFEAFFAVEKVFEGHKKSRTYVVKTWYRAIARSFLAITGSRTSSLTKKGLSGKGNF